MAEPPPAYWMIFVRWFLHTSDRLAKHLWHAFEHDCSPVVRWQLHICSERPIIERQQAFLDLVRPRHLLVAAERLCPAGKRRRKELVGLEERILVCTSATGGWR